MNNTKEINVIKISKQILYYYLPIWIVYAIITSWLVGQEWGIFAFTYNFKVMLVLPLTMYLASILPFLFFKSMSPILRRTCVISVCLIIAAINIYLSADFSNMNLPFYRFLFSTQAGSILLTEILTNLAYVVIVSWIYFVEEKQFITETKTIIEQNRRVNTEKKATETYLKLLQAQIEPHFLFNTLTSILSLSDTNMSKAKIMHKNFMQYLKTTLSKTRLSVTTVSQEIELIKSYLDIFKVRMGERLQYSIEADDDVNDLPFPSMLIQPIVENAIRHGLEPKIEGGEIKIKVTKREENMLCWQIEDTGLGMYEKSHLGTGLSNIIERIEMLYDNKGSLKIKENQPSGVKVIMEVPCV